MIAMAVGAYDNLEEDVLLLHGLDDGEESSNSSIGVEQPNKDAADVFTESISDLSTRGSRLDSIGKVGVKTGGESFRHDYADKPTEELRDRENFEKLMHQLANSLRRGDSLGRMDDVSVQIIREAASRTWGALKNAGQAVYDKFVGAVKKLIKYFKKGDEAKKKAEKRDKETNQNIAKWKKLHKDNRRKWRAMRNAVARQTGEIGALGGFASKMDRILNKRGEKLQKLAQMYNRLSKKRQVQTMKYERLKGKVTGVFKKLPGLGDIGIAAKTAAIYIVAIAGSIAAIVGVIYAINKNFGKLTSSSSKEVESEKSVTEKLDETKEKLKREWGYSKRVGYDPSVDEPYQEIRDDEGRIIGIRIKGRFFGRDIEEKDVEREKTKEVEKEKRVDKEEGGFIGRMAKPLAIGGVAVAGLYMMTKGGGYKKLREAQQVPTSPPKKELTKAKEGEGEGT